MISHQARGPDAVYLEAFALNDRLKVEVMAFEAKLKMEEVLGRYRNDEAQKAIMTKLASEYDLVISKLHESQKENDQLLTGPKPYAPSARHNPPLPPPPKDSDKKKADKKTDNGEEEEEEEPRRRKSQ
jgi:type IV secretory pathway VirB10-like protein